ncbi:MAG: hypothetical protein QX191_06580 [Methylococcaceae bacterium]
MKKLTEKDFDFLGKPGPYLLGVKLERRECLPDKPRIHIKMRDWLLESVRSLKKIDFPLHLKIIKEGRGVILIRLELKYLPDKPRIHIKMRDWLLEFFKSLKKIDFPLEKRTLPLEFKSIEEGGGDIFSHVKLECLRDEPKTHIKKRDRLLECVERLKNYFS